MDDEALTLTAKQLKISTAEVERSLQIYSAFSKQRQRIRQQHIAKLAVIANEKAKYPARCFCVEEGILQRDWQTDYHEDLKAGTHQVKNYTWYNAAYPEDNASCTLYDMPYWLCKVCGKEYTVPPVATA